MKQTKSADNTHILKENKGSAIVMVLVIIAFISILVSVLGYRAVLNYQMKMVDYKSKDNFYSAESAMDEVRMGLAKVASDAATEAYVEIMQNYQNYTNTERAAQFSHLYILKVRAAIQEGGNDEKYDIDVLKNYLSGTYDPTTGQGVLLEASGGNNSMKAYTEALILEDVKLTYTDADGFVSIIETDIQMSLPAIDFNEAFRLPDILDYCVIANNSLVVQSGDATIKGSVYAGPAGIDVKTSTSLSIQDAELIVTDGTINVEGNKLDIPSADSNTWAKDIEITSAETKINGNAFIADDTTINGKNSKLTYSGAYYGFGQTTASTTIGSDGSSAILINGLNTTVDFSGLSTLALAGNAYIGILNQGDIGTDVGGTETLLSAGTTDQSTANNVMMGESLAIKSDQLAYLVPAECIGYKGDTCLIGCNPVTQAKLDTDFIQARANEPYEEDRALYKEVNMDKITSLGASLTGLNAKVQKLYRIEDSTTLVYYYLIFDNQSDANYFFRQYYANNKTKMDSYIKNYINADSKFGNFETMNINIAGNVMRQEGTGADATYILEEDSLMASTGDADYLSNLNYYSETYKALCTNLTKDNSTLSSDEINNKLDNANYGLFANIIDTAEFNNVISGATWTGGVNSYLQYGDEATDDYLALLIHNTEPDNDGVPDTPFLIDSSINTKVRVVVSDGDVEVTVPYKGIIITKGNIVINFTGSIEKDDDGVSKAMQKKVCGTDYSYINLFKDGQALAVDHTGGSGGSSDHVEVESLVGYRNWNKQ